MYHQCRSHTTPLWCMVCTYIKLHDIVHVRRGSTTRVLLLLLFVCEILTVTWTWRKIAWTVTLSLSFPWRRWVWQLALDCWRWWRRSPSEWCHQDSDQSHLAIYQQNHDTKSCMHDMGIQWNFSITDTLGTTRSVLIRGVSSFQRLICTHLYVAGTMDSKCSISEVLNREVSL